MIDEFVEKAQALEKKDMQNHKLAVDFARLEYEKRRFNLAIVAALVTVVGIGIGIWQSISSETNNTKRQLDAEKSRFQSALSLKFFDLDPDARVAFVESLRNHDGIDKAFVTTLEKSLKTANASYNAVEIASFSEPAKSVPAEIYEALKELTSTTSSVRRQARDDLARLFVDCNGDACLRVIKEFFQADSLASSESYRTALGIAVAIGKVEGEQSSVGTDFAQAFPEGPLSQGLLDTLRVLKSKYDEPALNAAVKKAIAKFDS